MSEETPRKVGVPTGETTYREVMIRSEYPDGTSVDSEPARIGGPTLNALRDFAAAMTSPTPRARPIRTIRYERSVTVYATEWVPTPAEPAEPAKQEAVS
jgi:hypothetical protein